MKNDIIQESTPKDPQGFIKRIPFYPLILGLYPVLYLWQANYVQVPAFVIERPLLFSLTLTGVVCLAAFLLLRNVRKAAALAALILGLFFYYGHFYNSVEGWTIFSFLIGRHIFTLILWGVLFVVGVVWIWTTHSDLYNMTWALNLMTGFLLLLTLVQLARLSFPDLRNAIQNQDSTLASQAAAIPPPTDSNTPDVYYLLLDAYGREDLLLQDVQLDNSGFISQLEELGFLVPDCTQSNYNTTVSSMGSTLNMNYLDGLGFSYADLAESNENEFTSRLEPLTLNNQVMQKFKELGYQIITVKVPYPFVDFPNSDVVLDFQAPTDSLNKIESSQFYLVYLRTTLMRVVVEATAYSPEKFQNLPETVWQFINPGFVRPTGFYYMTAQQNLYQLGQLENVAKEPGKKFVYAHLMVTHPPFTLTAEGDLNLFTNETKEGYRDSIIYANQRMITILQNILSQSETPPVIILQSDHGYGKEGKGEEQFKILNAYYLPQNGNERVYPQITPVNTFRLIFSKYFQQEYPLLTDQSIMITPDSSGGYRIVPQTCVES